MIRYSIIKDTFWTGETGQQLRSMGSDSLLVALYLLTCPGANSIGIFTCAQALMATHLSMLHQRVRKGLAGVIQTGFCAYDEALQQVWIPEMAKHQFGEPLAENDKRTKGIKSTIAAWVHSPFYASFLARYSESYHLSGLEAPSPSLDMPGIRNQESGIRNHSPKPPRGLLIEDLSVPESLQTPEALKAIHDWLEYKASRGEAYKRADHFSRKLAEFAKHGAEAFVASVDASIGNNWQGLFPAKSSGKASRQHKLIDPMDAFKGMEAAE